MRRSKTVSPDSLAALIGLIIRMMNKNRILHLLMAENSEIIQFQQKPTLFLVQINLSFNVTRIALMAIHITFCFL